MTTMEYRLQAPAKAHAGRNPGGGADPAHAAARRRLFLVVLWLAGLVGWGVLSYLAGDLPPADHRGSAAVAVEPQLDGRGKWTGYTSAWRSRSQILQDAGVTGRD